MSDKLRIAHCSDIHLDGDDFFCTPGSTQRELFGHALNAMCAQNPDLMLIAGDLFDSNRATQETVTWSMETLAEQPFPIFMIPGNHDCMQPEGIFGRNDFNAIDNLQMLSAANGEIGRAEELGVAVWGKGMEVHSPQYRPLGDCPARPSDCRWYLGMGHGMFIPHGEASDRSSPIAMREIESSPFDYLALGHHHAAMELITDTTVAAYSGSPTDDIGRGATFAIAEFATGEAPKLEILTVQ